MKNGCLEYYPEFETTPARAMRCKHLFYQVLEKSFSSMTIFNLESAKQSLVAGAIMCINGKEFFKISSINGGLYSDADCRWICYPLWSNESVTFYWVRGKGLCQRQLGEWKLVVDARRNFFLYLLSLLAVLTAEAEKGKKEQALQSRKGWGGLKEIYKGRRFYQRAA